MDAGVLWLVFQGLRHAPGKVADLRVAVAGGLDCPRSAALRVAGQFAALPGAPASAGLAANKAGAAVQQLHHVFDPARGGSGQGFAAVGTPGQQIAASGLRQGVSQFVLESLQPSIGQGGGGKGAGVWVHGVTKSRC